jgi:hypothetical protein
MTMIEAKLGDDWADLTRYVQAGGERALEALPPRIESGRRFGRTEERQRALRARVLALQERLEITGGTGNLMVNICRSGTRTAALDKAWRARGGDGQTAPKHPNDRLRHYGLRVTLKGEVIGGTARQRACYWRAVARYVG